MGTIFLLFNTYHFGVQHFGVLTIYRLKAAQQLALNVRERERTLCLLLGGVLVLIGQLLHGADVVRESLLYTTIPATLSSIVRIAGIAAVLCGGAILIRDEVQASVTSFPKLLYKTALIAQALAAFILPALPFLILWAVQHWLVSVGLGLHMTGTSARHGVAPGTNLWWRSWSVINRHPMLAAAVLAGFSAIFTPLLLLPTKVVSGATSGTELPNLIEWFRHHETATLVLIGLNFGTVFCHFLYDRAVFRFSHAETRATSGKLLFS
jgi:hypothetical protein